MKSIKSSNTDFRLTKAYSIITDFIFRIDNSIKNEPQLSFPRGFIIERIRQIVEDTELSSIKGRFANPAMVTVIEQIETLTDNPYLSNSFGNKIRMDFGTGHELNFLCYLYSLVDGKDKKIESPPIVVDCRGGLKIELCQVSSILTEYFRIIRFYVEKFNIEPAGSRGCWCIDDYLLLPYLFGSSECFNSSMPVELVGKGMFRESCMSNRSPMLKNICKLPWQKINHGMIKMYDEEVLGKKVVTQHFIYSDILPI
ncbi:uncharacterized protein VICG_00756 [Vittaforma corneae ATCC 50505]|uniref:Serine/threonine-protein phosphatase 2A activator n=1 Tax=Vittaforma corneae (strain ATCC 50505) TaxID=993615 RepID=L2GNR0_VITCO|nr:uncharacterized protein VICG_00756 [Vittaforma corneae ATCC 50505]ELA42115.1 hypothetical protein VICG_00756 [Vittaforma corneae ATCC 50505]